MPTAERLLCDRSFKYSLFSDSELDGNWMGIGWEMDGKWMGINWESTRAVPIKYWAFRHLAARESLAIQTLPIRVD